MANIPPQENWFSVAELGVAATSGGTVLLTYDCPKNRCAQITGWAWDETGSSGSTVGIYYSGKDATGVSGPGTPLKAILIAQNNDDPTSSAYYPTKNGLHILMGPGDQLTCRVVTGTLGATWDVGFFVREIGPASGNMGSWTE